MGWTAASLLFTLTLFAQAPDDAIQRLETTVAKNPHDMGATMDLLQRYATQADNPDALDARRKHILRLIEHDPEARALSAPPSSLDPKSDPQGYTEAARLWRQQTAKSGVSAKTFSNAAFFFRVSDPPTAFAFVESGLKTYPGDADLARMRGILDAVTIANRDPLSPESQKARQELETTADGKILAGAGESMLREPGRGTEDPLALAERWLKRAGTPDLLVTVYQRESGASLDPRAKVRYLNQALQAAETDVQRLRVLPDLANFEFETGDNTAAERDARRLLDLAAANPKLGNHDDLIHAGHTVLGRVALDQGEKTEAIAQMVASVQIKRTNGPKMTLAQDLLDAGERDLVLRYLELLRPIWNNGQGRLDHYIKVARAPGKGDLFAPFTPSDRPPPPKRILAVPVVTGSVAWKPVPGAESYVVEWDSRDEKGWSSERSGGLVHVIPTRETTVTLDFSGERPIRWRVYAVSQRTGAGKTSDWHEIQNPARVLPEHAEAELDAGHLEAAERDARQLLRMAETNAKAWNHGDLAHAANTLLGRVALRRGDVSEAKEFLAASVRIEGSPTLNSFGPSMRLAQELLAAGERDAVLQYLEACRAFWKSDRGRLDHLINIVDHGSAPNLLSPDLNQAPSLVGEKAPSFKLKDLTGKDWTLDELAGKVVVLDFWATWCQPCLEQFSVLEKMAQQDRVVVLAVDVGEDEDTVRGFLKKNYLAFPVLLAGDNAMTVSYRVTAYPTLALIDRAGRVHAYHIGNIAGPELAAMLSK